MEKVMIGCLLGTAVGDALGLPYEGLSKGRQKRLFGDINGHRLFFGRGMVSDDTDHTLMVAQAILQSGGSLESFQRDFSRRLRFWLLTLPAGIGKATLRSLLKLWLGSPPSRSGVFSAGNGPAMRSAILGLCFGDNPQVLKEWVQASTQVTHTDPKAYHGALAVALAAYVSCHFTDEDTTPDKFYRMLRGFYEDEFADDWVSLVETTIESVKRGEPTETFAEHLGLIKGVSGYVYHTVPVALHAWLTHPCDYRAAVKAVIRCGGDTDTTAAIVGGIVGARVGKAGIPEEWLNGLCEWPWTVLQMESLGMQLAKTMETENLDEERGPSLRVPPLGLLRNLVFLLIILFHGFRRLFPPY